MAGGNGDQTHNIFGRLITGRTCCKVSCRVSRRGNGPDDQHVDFSSSPNPYPDAQNLIEVEH